MLLSLLRLERGLFLRMVQILVGMCLAWEGIVCAVMAIFRPEESIFLTAAMLPLMGAVTLFILIPNHVAVIFQNGVRMGRTRREMLGLTLGVCAVHTALIGILCALLVFLERTVFFRVWAFLAGRPGAVLMENAPGGGKLWEPIFDTGVLRIEDASFLLSVNAPLLILAGSLGGFVFGAIFQRFGGARAVSSLPVLLVWVFLLLPNLVLPDTFTQAVSPYQLPLLVLVLSAGMAWSVWSLLHAVIRE